MTRNRILIAIAALVIVAGAVFFLVIAPAGTGSASTAALARVKPKADAGSAKVLAEQDWGGGRFVLVGYDHSGTRRLGLAFSAKGMRGWRVSAYTEKTVEADDVVVGSLLVASSNGGSGQPAWSAAVGELVDTRIDKIQVKWANGTEGLGPRTDKAYLVVSKGRTTANEVDYLANDGTEIAKVPVSG